MPWPQPIDSPLSEYFSCALRSAYDYVASIGASSYCIDTLPPNEGPNSINICNNSTLKVVYSSIANSQVSSSAVTLSTNWVAFPKLVWLGQ